ncbi:hypothetical protein AVEN_9316-1 [Araneus ventricosus]|uniref:Uncharacterized protein n=1 Tax=Araneus ventricosus TaxID=182803 RepID=A0A4Y2R380_ARAVE|nr:hypothetical protein AVEN_9316-1 [Araneus ventricosus]
MVVSNIKHSKLPNLRYLALRNYYEYNHLKLVALYSDLSVTPRASGMLVKPSGKSLVPSRLTSLFFTVWFRNVSIAFTVQYHNRIETSAREKKITKKSKITSSKKRNTGEKEMQSYQKEED